MRTFTSVSLFAILILTASASAIQAQDVPFGMVDSSFRMEFLFGRQSHKLSDDKSGTFSRFGADFDPRVALLSGTVEVSPFPLISGRFAGGISVFERSGSVNRNNQFDPNNVVARWSVEPDVGYWELAGLYHLWNGGGYRFSCTAGYRREVWKYHGESVGSISNAQLRDEFASQVPFLGLQTAMFFPNWRARFEVLGSAFMNEKVSSRLQLGSFFTNIQGTINQGGLLEFQMEGNVAVTQYVWCGLHARYTYQELRGEVTADTGAIQTSLDLATSDNYLTVGLDLTVVF